MKRRAPKHLETDRGRTRQLIVIVEEFNTEISKNKLDNSESGRK